MAEKKDWKHIAERIEEFRLEKGWKKKEFAQKMNINYGNIAMYLRGELDPKNMFYKLHEHGADLQYIIHGVHSKEPPLVTSDERELIEYLRRIGITTVEKARALFSPEALAQDVALALKEKLESYFLNNYKKKG